MDTLLADSDVTVDLDEAYSLCERLARSHYENFTVVSWFLPGDIRRHLYAIYAFCRFVDDLGDEFAGDRSAALDLWEEEIGRCFDGLPRHPYMIALQNTIRTFDIPREPFLKLVRANRIDQTVRRHATYDDLDYYCQHSANPVGHLVLYVCGYRDKERMRLADYTCTALQLTNFWQDVARDFAMGRIYIPQEDMERFGYSEEDLAAGVVNRPFREMMAFEVERARELFREGLDLVRTLDGRIRIDIALFSLGGMKVLDAIEARDYDVLTGRPELSRAARIGLMLRTALRVGLMGKL